MLIAFYNIRLPKLSNMSTTSKTATSFWVISIIALIWNIMGLIAFFGDIFISQEALAALPDAQRELYESTPSWLRIFYGIAVFGGTLGCIALLIKKSFAIPLFIISLIAIVIQMGFSFFMTNAVEVNGIISIIMPIIVIAIAIFLLWYARHSKAKGWIA